MDEVNTREVSTAAAPQLPARPGHIKRIQSIDSLKAESKPNDYVDVDSKIIKPLKPASYKSKVDIGKKSLSDKLDKKAYTKAAPSKFKVDCTSPPLPPRSRRPSPPPLPPRSCLTSSNSNNQLNGIWNRFQQPATPALKKSSTLFNSLAPLTTTNTATSQRCKVRHEPLIVVITEQPTGPRSTDFRFPQLSRGLTTKSSSHAKPITEQPTSVKQESTITLSNNGAITTSILCPDCGECRCGSCTGEKELPEHWLCEGNCLCSAKTVVDTASCLCCVKSCFSSCFDNPNEPQFHPCSCGAEVPQLCARWMALSAVTLCLPCLLCYWPMQGGVKAATACYNSTCCRGQRGCRCSK